jgi:hypothetical protein
VIELRAVLPHEANRLAMEMGPRLRAGDMMECRQVGLSGYEAVAQSLSASLNAWGAFDQTTPLAVWGVIPLALVGATARVWFLTAEGVQHHRKLLLRASADFVQAALAVYSCLEAVVHSDYVVCLRWLRWLGFSISAPLPDAFDGKFCRATIGPKNVH